MVIAVGSVVYEHGSPPCSGIGLQWSREDLDDAMEGDVAAILFDDAGKAEIASIFIDVPETGFTQKRLSDALKAPIEVDDWRVGEAIAESYLVYHRSCCFPWPVGRDERKTGSSLPGADLVGFVTDDDGDRLAFGEGQDLQPNQVSAECHVRAKRIETSAGEFARLHIHTQHTVRVSRAPFQEHVLVLPIQVGKYTVSFEQVRRSAFWSSYQGRAA